VIESARIVVLSPHLDDAALGIGALISQHSAAGLPVEVWTVFTRTPDLTRMPRSQRTFGDYRIRIEEDQRAMRRLGASRRMLDLPERIWRQPGSSLRAAFQSPADVSGFTELSPLTAEVCGALSDPTTLVLAPLGIGHHVDHLEVALAVVLAAHQRQAWRQVAFYEDYYALGGNLRRTHPVTAGQRRGAGSSGLATIGLWLALWSLRLVTRGPALTTYLPIFQQLHWSCSAHPVTSSGERSKLEAVAEYASQTSRLGGMFQLKAAIRASHQVHGGELLWTADPLLGGTRLDGGSGDFLPGQGPMPDGGL
jgi:LmbE family N-acetylglucosaminyl deacetylase